MNRITIITPTYNRAGLLKRLYDSLKKQSNKSFCWFIVDDGSLDNTTEEVNSFIIGSDFEITYIKQDNGGKHRALNNGIKSITTELTFIVDSDDYLPNNAVDTILKYHDKYLDQRKENNLCGYSFLRCFEDGSVNTAKFNKDEEIGTYREIRINQNLGGDKAEVFYTDILKQYPFKEYENEKFMPEDEVWIRMSGPYNMVHINECVYISEYLEGGLTKSGRSMKIHSPLGMMARSKAYLDDADVVCKVKIKMMLLYIIYGKFAGLSSKEIYSKLNNKGLFILLFVPAKIIGLRWK